MWQSEYLVSVCLNSTGFVDAYMSDLCCDHTLIAFKQCIDYSSIGLETRQRLLSILKGNIDGFINGKPVNVVS